MEVQAAEDLTRTEYAVCYSREKADPEFVKAIKQKLQKASVPFLFDSSYFVPFLRSRWQGIFQPVSSTERPIVAAARICEGKVVVLVGGSPFALICPGFFAENFESLDDYAFPAYFAAISRGLRYIAFLAAVFLPGLYVMAVNFTPEIMPQYVRGGENIRFLCVEAPKTEYDFCLIYRRGAYLPPSTQDFLKMFHTAFLQQKERKNG